MSLDICPTADGVAFAVKVVPGSSRSRVAGLLGNALKVNIAAPPEKGRANNELLRLLAGLLDRPGSDLSILSGAGNAHKKIEVRQMSTEQLSGILADYIR